MPTKAPAEVVRTVPVTPSGSPDTQDLAITVDVEPRKPRLAWHGMERKGLAPSVPTQVVEIVRPGRAVERKGELDLSGRAASREDVRPENRLIWTSDNLVALQTLLEERDPKTKDYRYRGKIDLVYIDPPFMVDDDFRADNAIEIELDEKAHVQARKEPSLVEILAYKDTWRQGLDSFLSMLRARLLLLKQLLMPTGTIFVHLDWHAVHYVKVLMDEIFGYENLVNEIIWQRQTSHNDLAQGAKHLGRVHDTILVYRGGLEPFMAPLYTPHEASYIRSHYKYLDEQGRRFRYDNLIGPGGAAKGNAFYELMGHKKYWRHSPDRMKLLVEQGRVVQPSPGAVPAYKRFLHEMPGNPLQDVWTDVAPINSQAVEALGYPTQKPRSLLERIIALGCPPNGLVLDCFVGSGTTAEAAERLGRRWVGIDNGKYGIHLARKRLIQLHGQPRPPEKLVPDYVECKVCKSIERKEKPQKSSGPYVVRAFTVENMGVYQRASEWQGFQQHRSAYRDEMIKVFGGEPVEHSPLLHGRKGNSWVHVGPLDGPVSSAQVWSIAREAQRTSTKAVTVLSADFDTVSGSEKAEVQKKTGVLVTIRVIPASAIDEVKRRLDLLRVSSDVPVESTAVPAFYAPLSIILEGHVTGRNVELKLKRCEVDIESFIASQRPVLKPITDRMSPTAKKKAQGEIDRWKEREAELISWLKKATSWQAFVDFWAVDWNYGREVGEDEKPIFVTEWQSFRARNGDANGQLTFSAKFTYAEAGRYRVAARVTDVFGNDGIATIDVEVRR
jgi:adenine-specific DNA-methyltransferase